jgi:hypothetical protein
MIKLNLFNLSLKFIFCFVLKRLVMQTCSPYFTSLLSLNLKETQQNMIELQQVSTNIFELLLNYIYTGLFDEKILIEIFKFKYVKVLYLSMIKMFVR